MSEPCVNDSDLYFIEDFTDPLNLSRLRRRKKMVKTKKFKKNNRKSKRRYSRRK